MPYMKRPLNPSARCGLAAAWCIVTDAGSQTPLPLLNSAFRADGSEVSQAIWQLKTPAGCTHPLHCHSSVARKYLNLKSYISLLTLMAGSSIFDSLHVWLADSLMDVCVCVTGNGEWNSKRDILGTLLLKSCWVCYSNVIYVVWWAWFHIIINLYPDSSCLEVIKAVWLHWEKLIWKTTRLCTTSLSHFFVL